MDPVVVVGGGISGVACARELTSAGLPVRLLDRGQRVGGRMGGRRVDGRPVDLGASYFTVDDEDFAGVVEQWRAAGLAHPWTDTFTVLAPGATPESKSGPVRWGASAGLRSLVEALATGLDPHHHDVRRVTLGPAGPQVDGEPASAVVLAMPDPQAVRLLGDGLGDLAGDLEREFEPVLALAARWSERTWDAVAPEGRFEGAFVNDDDALAWVADDGRRRGDDAPVLVAHSTPALARAHLETPEDAEPAMRDSLARLLGVGDPVEALVHRWSFAKPAGDREERSRLEESLVGVCGDGWGPGSKVETAWLSGRDLGRRLTTRLAP